MSKPITRAIDHLTDVLPKIKSNLGSATVFTKNQLVGSYVGNQVGLNLLNQYENIKIDRKVNRKLNTLMESYMNKSNKYAKEFKLNEFQYEFAVIKISKSIRLILGEIDIDKFKAN